jgi:hypothetical protein
MFRAAGVSGILAGVLLAAGHLLFALYVPDDGAARAERHTLVVIVGGMWLIGHIAMTPALIGIYSRRLQQTGLVGGTGLALCVGGTLGLSAFVFQLFPELIGRQVDTFQEMQVALLLQAIGELSATSLLFGLVLFGLATELSRRCPPGAGVLVVAGAIFAALALLNEDALAIGAVVVSIGLIYLGAALTLEKAPRKRLLLTTLPAGERRSPRFWARER